MAVVNCREISKEMQGKIKALILKFSVKPILNIILVGNNPASSVYVSRKSKLAKELGMECQILRMDENSSQEDIRRAIASLNQDPKVNGILLQMPLPPGIKEPELILEIDPRKDVDGFHPLQQASKLKGDNYFVPCTPLGCIYLLKKIVKSLAGMNALVIGRSFIVGKPMASLLLEEDCTVTIAHSHTKNIPELCQDADILVVAVGRPNFVQGNWIKKNSVVLDVGINRLKDGTLTGDVDFAVASQIADQITSVPGGVGLMTVTMLAWNTLRACLWQETGEKLKESEIL